MPSTVNKLTADMGSVILLIYPYAKSEGLLGHGLVLSVTGTGWGTAQTHCK